MIPGAVQYTKTTALDGSVTEALTPCRTCCPLIVTDIAVDGISTEVFVSAGTLTYASPSSVLTVTEPRGSDCWLLIANEMAALCALVGLLTRATTTSVMTRISFFMGVFGANCKISLKNRHKSDPFQNGTAVFIYLCSVLIASISSC